MGWKTGTCGAPPAAGRRPASGSSTEPFRPLLPNVATQGPGKALPGIRGVEFLGGIKAKKKKSKKSALHCSENQARAPRKTFPLKEREASFLCSPSRLKAGLLQQLSQPGLFHLERRQGLISFLNSGLFEGS